MLDQDKIICKGSYFTIVWFGFILLVCFSGLFTFIRAFFIRPISIETVFGLFVAIGCTLFSAYKTYQGFVIINTELTLHDEQITLKQFKYSVTIKISEITKITGIRRKASLLVQDLNGQEIVVGDALKDFVKIAEHVLIHASEAKIIANNGYFFHAKDGQAFLKKHNINVQQ